MKTRRNQGGAAALIALAISAAVCDRAGAAVSFTATGSSATDGTSLAASANFALVGGDLQITIQNTATTPTSEAANVLTALFFDINGAGGISVDSEYIPSGDKVFNDTTSTTLAANLSLPGTVLGQSVDQWQYKTIAPQSGLGSAGLNFFNGNQVSKDGLVSPNYVPTDGLKNNGQTVFQDTIVVLLKGYGGNLSDISNVEFQYGTSMSDTSLTGTLQTGNGTFGAAPEANFALGGAVLLIPLGLGMLARGARAPRRQETIWLSTGS